MIRVRIGLIALACAILWGAAGPESASAPVPREAGTPYVKWSVPAERGDGMHDPLAVNDLVVVGTDKGELRAYRAGSGAPAWAYQHGKRIYHRPVTDGERVFFAAEDGLVAVAAATGAKVWSFGVGQGAGPVLALPEKGLVFKAASDGTLYAVDAETGDKRWAADFAADAPPDRPGFPGDRARTSGTKARPNALTSDGEAVFLSVFDQSRVIAVSATTGKRLWAFQAGGWVSGAAVATATRVFVGSKDQAVYCLDKRTGAEVWKFKTGGQVPCGGAVDEKFVYVGSCDGSVYCLSQSDGGERWRFDTDRRPDGGKSAIYSVPVLHRGAVHIAAGEGQFYALAADSGRLRWKVRAEERSDLYCSPATDGRSYFVVTRPQFAERGKPAEGVSALVAIALK